jgi:lysozyme family protein
MKNVRQLAAESVHREGGFVNDPDDLGGATNFGVTIHTMRRLGMDLDGDGDVDVADVRGLTLAQATDVFVEHYFEAPRIADLPTVLHETVFDMYVNSGNNAIKILQRMMNSRNAKGRRSLATDGAIGPATIAEAHTTADEIPDQIEDAYGIARRNYYYAIADSRPRNRKFAKRRDGGKGGWITRAEEFIDPKYHLTDAEHTARTRNW